MRNLLERETDNVDRAHAGLVAIRAFQRTFGANRDDKRPDETDLGDLVGDLLHLADALGIDPEEIIRMGRLHYTAEINPRDDITPGRRLTKRRFRTKLLERRASGDLASDPLLDDARRLAELCQRDIFTDARECEGSVSEAEATAKRIVQVCAEADKV